MPCRVEPELSNLERTLSSENYNLQKKVDALETELCILREYLLNKQDFEEYKEKIFRESQIQHRKEDVENMIQRELNVINTRIKSLNTYKGTEFESLFKTPLTDDINKATKKIEFLKGLTEEQLLNRVYLDNQYYL